MIRSSLVSFTMILVTSVLPNMAAAQDDSDGWRTIEIETTEVTAPDVAITPDGKTLIFTMLGKLFRLPVEGGDAEQLTFGPYCDARPAVSPDGKLVAFQSDRDGSEGNIFLLELATRDITQLTYEPWADAPSWAPDGQSVVYLRLVREAWNASDVGPNRNPRRPPPPAMVRRVSLNSGEPGTGHRGNPMGRRFRIGNRIPRGLHAGTRLSLSTPAEPRQLVYVENFFEELKAKVGN